MNIRFLVVFAWLAPLTFGQQQGLGSISPEEQACLASSLPLLQRHAFSDAESELTKCQTQYPQSAILNNALGIVYEQEGRKEEAARSFEKALVLLPSFTAAQIHLGTLYAGFGQCDAAKSLLTTAAASTSYAGALVASGAGLAQCRDLSASINVLEKALKSNPQSVSAVYNLALAHYQKEDFEASLTLLATFPADQVSEDPDFTFLKAKDMQGIRKKTKPATRKLDADIADLLSKACRLNPREDSCTQSGLELINQDRFLEATDLLEKAITSTGPSVHLLSALGLARFRLGRYADAIEAYSKAIQIDPSLEAPREGLAFLLYMTGDLNQARTIVEQGTQRSGSEFYLLYLRALILYRMSNEFHPEALASATACINKNPAFAPAYFLRGKISSDQNDLASALKDFQSAVSIDPKYPLPYYRMARIYSRLGRVSDSEAAARQFSMLGSLREDDLLTNQAREHLTSESN